MQTGIDRFIADERKNLLRISDFYRPYPMQYEFHASPARYKCLGGAAGPGKTLALIMEHMQACQDFNVDDARQVHTLLLRRTYPQLASTVITRFDEKVPRELYDSFNRTKNIVTWKSGATTNFGSMQHESDAMGWQGQWLKISYDEMAEFTFKQWLAVSAWNRCPVSRHCTKDGATNPIGVGAPWIRSLFVDHKPYEEMDKSQVKEYDPEDYGYFPCTYLDNPVFANDPEFVKSLDSLPESLRLALKNGSWDLVGGYFQGAYDPACNVVSREQAYADIQPWHKRWISGDWGFEHPSAIYWHYKDDCGVVRTYKERVVKHMTAEMLSEMIVKESYDPDHKMPEFESFYFSHDAFASNSTKTQGSSPTPTAIRMGPVLKSAGLPLPSNAGRDALGRETGMYAELKREVYCGFDQDRKPIMRRAWEISEDCPKLMQCLATAPRDPEEVERIEPYLGDDPLQGAGYGIQWITGKPGKPTHDQKLRVKILEAKTPEEKHWLRWRETKRRESKDSGSGDYWT